MIKLPAQLNPVSRRKDKSVKLSFETRELTSPEVMTLLSLEGSEGWLIYAPNESDIDEGDVPDEKVELDTKTPSQRLKSVLYVLYKQETKSGKYVGLFPNFYQEHMEKLIEFTKKKIEQNE